MPAPRSLTISGLTIILLLSSVSYAFASGGAGESFSVKEYEEFHDVLHPLEHEALPQGDFKRIRAESKELARRGEAILKLGVPSGVRQEHTQEFREELGRFRQALTKFQADAEKGTDEELRTSYSAVHDSFEMLAALLPRKKA